ncbi:MAG TPA: ATP-binding protein [Candidatus Dormibacteraeota bacterium]|nr:ATP-binding protein [Candidatus Dormibacteraeota bacterium]
MSAAGKGGEASGDDHALDRFGRVLARAGEVGALITSMNWGTSPLGVPRCWPSALRSAVSMILLARSPLAVFWGPELAMIYNDASIPLLGDKHPSAVGQPASKSLAELWPTIGDVLEGVLRKGEASWSEDLLLMLERHGYVEETYFTLSFSPVYDEEGRVGGILGVAAETTGRVLGERRLVTVSKFGGILSRAASGEEACALAADLLAEDAADLPFVLIYLLSADGRTIQLAGRSGLPPETPASPTVVDLSHPAAWPFAEVIRSGRPAVVETLPDPAGRVEIGLGPQGLSARPAQAVVMPVARVGERQPLGVMVAGISPWRRLDADYRAFLDLVAAQLATMVTNVQAYAAERQRAQTLADLDQAKTALLSDVSHEFRTPLTLLIAPLEDVIADAQGLSPEQMERLHTMHRNSLRLLKLVNALLDISRIEAGRVQAHLEPVDLASLTAELASAFKAAVELGGLELIVDCPPLSEPVYVDREMWETIVLNLLSNAFKFTLEGRIRVRLRVDGTQAVLSVSDTGLGIPPGDRQRIFQRFHRIPRPGARTNEGAGIGLALVADLVRLLGGRVAVTSEEGRGTTFTVRVPTGSPPATREQAPSRQARAAGPLGAAPYVQEALSWLSEAAEAAPVGSVEATRADPQLDGAEAGLDGREARVLVVDDDPDMRAYLRQLLGRHWTVELCSDGASALAAALADPPDLVLTDIMMPDLGGLELVRRLRSDARTAHLPVIVVSARVGSEAMIEGLGTGADDYLLKPFSSRELIARVRVNLDLVRLRNELARIRAEASLAGARRDFMNMAAHELRGPLAVLVGYLSMLQDGTVRPESPVFAEAVGTMLAKASEATALVERILTTARLEANRLTLRVEMADLRELVGQAVERARTRASGTGETLRLHLPRRPVIVPCDRGHVGHILDDLIVNALVHGAGGGVLVSVADGDEPTVRVRDWGPGIPEDMRERIFEPFVRVEEHLPGRGGPGLGLSIARGLAEAHGGSLTLEVPADRGVCFVLRLPAASPDRPGSPGEPGQEPERPNRPRGATSTRSA